MTDILEIRGVTRRFAGLVAVNQVSFTLAEGEILGLIGPNGAGKTTLVSLISGTLAPTHGDILYQGRPIGHLPAYRRARLGIGRTFQIMRPFPGLSVLDNVAVGALFEARDRGLAIPGEIAILGFGDTDIAGEIEPGLTTIGVDSRRLGVRAGELLLQRLNGQMPASRQEVFPLTLNVRAST